MDNCPNCERLRPVAEAALAYRNALRDSANVDTVVDALLALDAAVVEYGRLKDGLPTNGN